MDPGYLLNKDMDWLIAKRLFRRGHQIRGVRFLNKVLLVFSPRPSFCMICLQRFQQLVCRDMKLQTIQDLLPRIVHNNSFWTNAVKRFATGKLGERIVFDGGQKGNTRKRLYSLGMIFGYRYLFIGSKRYEKSSNRGKIYYGEDKIDWDKPYTMQELVKLKVDFPDMWIDTGEKTTDGKKLYAASTEKDRNGRGWYKRGIMCNSPGTLIFIKV